MPEILKCVNGYTIIFPMIMNYWLPYVLIPEEEANIYIILPCLFSIFIAQRAPNTVPKRLPRDNIYK